MGGGVENPGPGGIISLLMFLQAYKFHCYSYLQLLNSTYIKTNKLNNFWIFYFTVSVTVLVTRH